MIFREIWMPIIECPQYHVSSFGRVYSSYKNRVVSPGGRTKRGYIQYHLYGFGERYVLYIHRLVAAAFIDPNIDGFEVDHLDDDPSNNYVGNLEIVTPKINSQRAYDRGRRIPPSMKSVMVVETNEQFSSISDCARSLGRSLSSVAYALNHGTPTAGVHLEEVMP